MAVQSRPVINNLLAPLTSACTELTPNMCCCCWMGRAQRGWGGGFPSIPPAPTSTFSLPSAAGVSGPSRAADCLWQPRYFKSGVWAKLEWAIPPVPAEGPRWFALLLRREERGGEDGGMGGQESCYLQPSKPLFLMQSAQLAPLWGRVSSEQSWMFAAPSLSPLTSSLFLAPSAPHLALYASSSLCSHSSSSHLFFSPLSLFIYLFHFFPPLTFQHFLLLLKGPFKLFNVSYPRRESTNRVQIIANY